jgi:nitronate monooxygenase
VFRQAEEEPVTELSTEWSRSLGLSAPIVNAPMGGVAGGALAAAVSRAGGLGMVGMGSAGSADTLTAELRQLSGLGRPFGIGLVDWVVSREPQMLTAALDAQPALLAVSFGDNSSWVEQAHDRGVLAAAQVGDLLSAQRAVEAGVDVVIARGAEAGGHGEPRVGTLPLLTAILDELSVPILAAGGISTGRALAAVLAAGAAGAWVGTAFAVCAEASTAAPVRQVLLEASDTDTVTTRVFDVALGYPWPENLPERVIRNSFVDTWTGREDELAVDEQVRVGLAAAIGANDHRFAPVNAGQGVGMLHSVRTAAEVVAQMCAEGRSLLDRW